MKYIIDHDFHIHTYLSLCSRDEEQTIPNIIKYAKNNNLKKICITNHFWDENVAIPNKFYRIQNFDHIITDSPFPKENDLKICFGCETDLWAEKGLLGIQKETFDKFDFVIIPTTHLNFVGMTIKDNPTIQDRVNTWYRNFEMVLDMDLPFHKIGIAHLGVFLIGDENWDTHIKVLSLLEEKKMERLFKLAASKGCGIELNIPIERYDPKDIDTIMRPFVVAKRCGCKFYLGSDAHHPEILKAAPHRFKFIVDYLKLEEKDKWSF